jgi:cobalt-zinc-cadmium efflux system outer membrane protein
MMGLSGPSAAITLPADLPPIPTESLLPFVRTITEAGLPGVVIDAAHLERRAVEASLDLAAARQDVETAAARLGITDVRSALPDLEVGGELERMEGEWEAGPEAEVVLPLFDQGQAARAAGRAELRRARALYEATAVDVRSAARVLAQRLATARRAGLHYQTVLLPLRAELSAQTLRQYNAMQTGVFGVLQAQRQEAEAARAYGDALAAYWTTRADLDLLLQGRMPPLDGSGLAISAAAPPMPTDAH